MKNFCNIKEVISIKLARTILKIFYVFPVNKKKIFLSSYEGKQFSCNPKYIYLKLQELDYRKLKYIYEYNSTDIPPGLCQNTKTVRHNSISYFFELLTSKVIVTNSGITAKVPIRKSQIVINTWHGGGAYKKCGKDISSTLNGSGEIYIDISEKQTTYFLSSCASFSKAAYSALSIKPEKIICSGLPRNDLFFLPPAEQNHRIAQIKKKLHFCLSKKIILYAPTYRGNAGNSSEISGEKLNVSLLLNALSQRFSGEWVFLYRGHYFSDTQFNAPNACDVSLYPDTQELLLISDVLITDYSSSVWDYSFTNKPAFLFVPDLDDYIDERNFYTPINQWPYHMAKTNEELRQVIFEYSPEKQKKYNDAHHMTLGSYEKGIATEMVIQLIIRSLK